MNELYPVTIKPVTYAGNTTDFRTPGADGAKDVMILTPSGICLGVLWDHIIPERNLHVQDFVQQALNNHSQLVMALHEVRKWKRDSQRVANIAEVALAKCGIL
jgi:hypothetical protein